PPGSERIPAVCPGAPNRRWSCGASPCSRTCKKQNRHKLSSPTGLKENLGILGS
ncbi:hypothetical protein ILYODFUR_006671, partial [Ilyodon furcidens]